MLKYDISKFLSLYFYFVVLFKWTLLWLELTLFCGLNFVRTGLIYSIVIRPNNIEFCLPFSVYTIRYEALASGRHCSWIPWHLERNQMTIRTVLPIALLDLHTKYFMAGHDSSWILISLVALRWWITRILSE